MDVEVLGVLKNMNGPKGDIILVRLHGAKAEYTGVVAGMSGSPVYFDGKLAGALAFRIGEFSKEPIAGVTPIAEMLEINAMDNSPGQAHRCQRSSRRRRQPTKTSGPGRRQYSRVQRYRQLPEADRNAAGLQRFHRRGREDVRPAIRRRGNHARHGRRFGQR